MIVLTKMSLVKIFLILIIGYLFLSCSQPAVTSEGKLLICNVDNISQKTSQLLLSELIDSIEIVNLETKEHSYISHIKKVSLSPNHIGILNDGQGAKNYKLFNRRGKFLNTIGLVGKGPFEYFSLSDAHIDEQSRKIYLADFTNVNELLCFDFDGNPVKIIPLAYNNLSKPRFFIRQDTITCFQIPIVNRSVLIFQQDMNGKVINFIPANRSMYANNHDGEIFVRQNTRQTEFSEFYYTGIDTLFHYDWSKNILIPIFHAQFNQPTIHTYTELPNHYIIWVYNSNSIFVRKHSLEASYFIFYNDIMDMPVLFYRFNKGHIILLYEAFEFKQFVKESLKRSHITEKMKTRLMHLDMQVNEEDNPVLVIGKLKK